MADEIFRPNDVVFDTMLDVLDRQNINPDEAPVVWGTSNFVVKNERTEAILDRIAQWVWLRPDRVSMLDFIKAYSGRQHGQSLSISSNGLAVPNLNQISEVRTLRPTSEKTIQSVSKILETLEDAPNGPITPHYLDALRAEHAAAQQRRRSQGIDFHSARQRNVWSLAAFARVFARLLGRQGGVSGLTAQEMDVLAAFHARHERLSESLLRKAFAQAASPTIPEILFQLQSLLHERND